MPSKFSFKWYNMYSRGFKTLPLPLVSIDGIGWKMKEKKLLKYDEVWVYPNMVNVNETVYDQ